MKKNLLIFLSLCIALIPALQADPLRIMRIGDSITWQTSGDATLPNLLAAAGIAYEFVGTQNWFDDGGYVPTDIAREEDQYNEGYPGMTVEWFTDPNFSWAAWQERPTRIERGEGNTPIRHALTANTPDVILLMIGTNNTQRDANNQRGPDSLGTVDVDFLLPKYNELLDQIELLAPQAHVIVAEIIDVIDTGEGNGANRSARTLYFNENVVRAAVQPRIAAGKSYTLVNFYSLLDVPEDFMDSVHPNVTGIPKMNAAWFEAIVDATQPHPIPTDNPLSAHYGPGNYPLWTQEIAWENVINMAEYSNGANHFERFENARDELYAQGGGVLFYPPGVYHFDLPDVGWGPGNGPGSRGLMLKSGVVIRGADLRQGADRAIIRVSNDVQDEVGFSTVTHNLAPRTVFTFPFHTRGVDPVTGTANSAGQVPSHWSFIGMMIGENEETLADVKNIGVVNVKLDGGFVFWGFHTPRSATMDSGRWLQNFKANWPEGAPEEQTWAKRAPDGTHYMDAINGGADWHTPISAGSGRLIFGVKVQDGAPWDDMTNLDGRPTATTELPADAFHSYRYTGRLTAHGTDIFIGNNVLARPTRNFVYRMLQRWDNDNNARREAVVLFDYSNFIGIDVNKSNYGGRQNDFTVVGPDTGYHYPNVFVRDNWIFNRGNKGMDIAGQYLVLKNNHNERLPIGRHVAPRVEVAIDYITNPQYFIENNLTTRDGTAINLGGVSFDGWRWQTQTTASDYMSRAYDIGGRNVWVHGNSALNPGSIGNDGEGVMAQRHNNIETYSWAFTENLVTIRFTEPGTPGKDRTWSGIYDMHAAGFLFWRNWDYWEGGIILAAGDNNWVLDATIGTNLNPVGRTMAPVTRNDGRPAVQFADYQAMHTDPVSAPINVMGEPLPNNRGIVITWEDTADNELGFRVERRFPGESWQIIAYRPRQGFGNESGVVGPYGSGLTYPELNPTRWTDFHARPDMGPEYRVVAFNALDDDSTGVSESFFADVDSLKLEVVGVVEGQISLTDIAASTLSATTSDGDGTPVSMQWSLLSGPGTVTFGDATAASTSVSFSVAGIYRLRVQASDATYMPFRDFTVNAGLPVVITEQPQPVSALVGSAAAVTVSAAGSAPFSYQWYKDGVAIDGATAATLSIAALALADSGEYRVVITNPLGTVTSAVTRIDAETAPVIEPIADRSAMLGQPVRIGFDFAAAPSPTFQWFFEGEPLEGQTRAELVFPIMLERFAGEYKVTVTNIHGEAESNTFTLSPAPLQQQLLINFSDDQSYVSDPAGNVWQSIQLRQQAADSAPVTINNRAMVNAIGNETDITFSFQSAVNIVGYQSREVVSEAMFSENPFAWFTPSEGPQRDVFAFKQNNGAFNYTFDGFDPDAEVTFEFVIRRPGSNRPITLIANPGTDAEAILLDRVDSALTQYVTFTTTGRSTYHFRLTSNINNWVATINAMSISTVGEFVEPTGPQISVVNALVRGEVGEPATLAVDASGTGDLSFQWFKDGVAIDGATGATLELDRLVFTDAGIYTVEVTDFMGSATSAPITVEAVVIALQSVFLETFDAGDIGEPVTVTLGDINWNVHHSSVGNSMIGRVVRSDPEEIFDPLLINEHNSAEVRGDPRFGSALGFVQLFINDWNDYNRIGGAPNRELAVLLWTENEVLIDEEARAGLTEFSFVQGNRNAASHSFLPAIRIGAEWYVYFVDQAYLRDNVRPQQQLIHQNPAGAAEFNAETVFGAPTFFNDDYFENTNGTNAQLYRFAWSESGWSRLVFDGGPGVDSTVGMTVGEALAGDLPAGEITAIGLFTPENIGGGELNGHRVDSIRLAAASELPLEQITPVILAQPQSVTADRGDSVTLAVEFTEPTGQATLQWFKGGEVIEDATDAVLTIADVQLTDAGAYQVRITNAAGTTTSATAQVSVILPPEVSPTALAVAAVGGPQTIAVTAHASINWTALSNVGWITVTAGASGTGDGSVAVSIAPNPTVAERVGTLAVAGVTVTVTQAAATAFFDVFPDSISVGANGESDVIEVEATEGAAWGIGSAPAWITFDVEGGIGDAEVTYTVAPNFSFAARSATVVIAGIDVHVTQAARSLTDVIPGLVEDEQVPGAFVFENNWLGDGYAFMVDGDVFVFSFGNGWWLLSAGEAGLYAFDYFLGTWLFTGLEISPWVYSFGHEAWLKAVFSGNNRSFWKLNPDGEWELVGQHDLAIR